MRKRFDALPSRSQQKILDRHRDWNVDHDWWYCEFDDLITELEAVGISTSGKRIFFRGFWSQGDCAYFGCTSSLSSLIQNNHPLLNDFPELKKLKELLPDSIVVTLEVQPNESMTSASYWEQWGPEEDDSVTRLQFLAEKAVYDAGTAQIGKFVEAFEETMRDRARKLYRDLKSLYDDLTSDEQVLESLLAHEEILEEAIAAEEEDE